MGVSVILSSIARCCSAASSPVWAEPICRWAIVALSTRDMIAGRGWIAIVQSPWAGVRTVGTALTSLLFGAADALSNALQVLILALVRFRLERDGYEVLSAPDGETALDLAVARTPDLALLDVMMPRLDGYEVTRRLREHDQRRRSRSSSSPPACGAGPGARLRSRGRRLRDQALQPAGARRARSGGARPVAVAEARARSRSGRRTPAPTSLRRR